MEKHTYGNSKAAEILVDIISEDKFLQRKVGSYWSYYTYVLNELIKVSDMDVSVRRNLGKLFYEDMWETISNSNLPEKVETFLKNIMAKKWRVTKDLITGEKESKIEN